MKGVPKEISGKNLWAIFVVSIAGTVIWELPYIKYTYYDPMLEAYNLTNTQAGLLLSMYAIGCMLLYIPGGILADKYSAKKLVLAATYGTALIGFGFYFVDSFLGCLLVFFLLAITTGMLFWSSVLKVVRILSGKAQAAGYGFYYGAGTFIGVANGAGQLAIYKIYENDPVQAMRAVVLFMSTVILIAAILVHIFYDEKHIDMANVEMETEEEKFHVSHIGKVIRNRYFWGAVAVMLCMYSVYAGQTYFTPYMTSQLGMEVTDSAFLSVLRTYVFYLLCPIGGYFADKVLKSTLRFYSYGFVFVVASYIAVLFIPKGEAGTTLAVALSLISAAFALLLYGVMWSIMDEVKIPVTYAATAIGIASIIVYAPDLFIHTLFGVILDHFGDVLGYEIIFMILAGVGVLAIIISSVLSRVIKRNTQNSVVKQDT